MIDFRYGLAGLVLFFAVCVTVTNWRRLLLARDPTDGRVVGTIPLLSIALTALAAFIHPGPEKRWMLLIPLADIATWLVVILPFWLMLKAFFPLKRREKLVVPREQWGEEKP